MTLLSMSLSPPNSLLLVLDPRVGELPTTLGSDLVTATSSALAVGTLMEYDGETQILLSDEESSRTVDDMEQRWRGQINTAGSIAIMSIENDVLLEIPAGDTALVEVWTNDRSEPDIVLIYVGPTD